MGRFTGFAKLLGRNGKWVAGGLGLGYFGWQKVVNDKSIGKAGMDLLVGEKTATQLSAVGNQAVGLMGQTTQLMESTGHVLNGVVTATDSVVDSVNQALSPSEGSSGNAITNALGGVGNFFKNLLSGNVSTLGVVGLIASGLLIFGRFGWMGKIAGALLGMMLIGNNSNIGQTLTASNSASQSTSRTSEAISPEIDTPTQGGGMHR